MVQTEFSDYLSQPFLVCISLFCIIGLLKLVNNMVDYSKWDKMKFSSSSEDESGDDDDSEFDMDEMRKAFESDQEDASRKDPSRNVEDLVQTLSDKTSWFSNLTEKERYEWLVDCYRMRVDDDYTWGGGHLHGLYEPDPMDGQKLTIIKDFLIFLKLAVRNGVIPHSDSFSFSECLKQANGLLPYAFEKSDARDKWGGENVFSTRPSLRRTAEAIYDSSCMNPHEEANGDTEKVYEEIECDVEQSVKRAFHKSNGKVFEEVGGLDIWVKLYRTMSV